MKLTKTKENAGKFLLDVAKLIIGGVILAGIMQHGIGYTKLYIFGGLTIVFCILWGLVLIVLSDNDKSKGDI
ncbi:MAG: ABC transporter permease [Bacteroides sp.]|nr:ABC transporter permease [Bacteroides sp.]